MSLVSISGGAGFLGLHLARRVLAEGSAVRTLDVAAARRRRARARRRGGARRHPLRAGRADARRRRRRVVHAAAALPIQSSRAAIRSVNVEGTANVLAAALEAGVRRVVLISSTAVYGVPERHPIHEDDPLVGVGWYGESKIEAEQLAGEFGRRGLDVMIVRPKTFIGPERLGVFEILFDWIREEGGSPSSERQPYQLLAVEDLVDAVVRSSTGPSAARRSTSGRGVRNRARRSAGPDRPCRLRLEVVARARRPAELALRALELAQLSPLAEWHYKTAHKDSFVSIEKARALLGWEPRSPTRKRCAPPTTGISRTSTRCAGRGPPTACRGTSRRSGS